MLDDVAPLKLLELVDRNCKDSYQRRLLKALFKEQLRISNQFLSCVHNTTSSSSGFYSSAQSLLLQGTPSSRNFFNIENNIVKLAFAFNILESVSVVTITVKFDIVELSVMDAKTTRALTLYARQKVVFDQIWKIITAVLNIQ